MKIAAVAEKTRDKEMLMGKWPPGAEWTWVSGPAELQAQTHADLYIDMDFRMDQQRILTLSALLPCPVLINSVVYTLEQIGEPFIRFSGWPSPPAPEEKKWLELAATKETENAVSGLFSGWGISHRMIPDLPGLVSPRILATIINEAYYTLQEQVSTKEEIDTAMRLGTNYPQGPFEWSELIGLENIHELLSALSRLDHRYVPALLLTKTMEKAVEID